jgi:hypothetical protein
MSQFEVDPELLKYRTVFYSDGPQFYSDGPAVSALLLVGL